MPALSTLPPLVSQPFKRAALGLFHGKVIQYGNNVPHSKKKTRRNWLPNVQPKTLSSELLGRSIKVKVTTRALRTIHKVSSMILISLVFLSSILPVFPRVLSFLLRLNFSDTVDWTNICSPTSPSLLGDEGMRLRILVREQHEAKKVIEALQAQRDAEKAAKAEVAKKAARVKAHTQKVAKQTVQRRESESRIVQGIFGASA
ncbi:mitochondrial 50S ribosomal protein L28-like protein [Melanogaster broomeanus]|nr:mitochondrial 50S ribosomal protein L28-like protein [Melanogaster broomeanus]